METTSDFKVGDQVEVIGGGRYEGRIGRVFWVQSSGVPEITGLTGALWEAVVGVPAVRPEYLRLLARAPFQIGDRVTVTGGRRGRGETGVVSAVHSTGAVQVSGLSGRASDALFGDPYFESAYVRHAQD
ncbi:hypothetical protein [Kitasatospora sp. NPDC008115]|uniref:hypothetical protein n=1 Tax=Kitasatospora sp. NPDC008115 TaxID=3364022 RepID=UPI0036E1CF63